MLPKILNRGVDMVVKGNEVKEKVLPDGLRRKILAYGGSLMAVEVAFKKGDVGALHYHANEQVSYVIKGSFELILDGRTHIIKAGDSFYASQDIEHGAKALEDSVILDIFTPQRVDFL